MSIVDSNKLIAEFMGVEYTGTRVKDYDTSWDWLMPVVKKINEQISPNVRGLWRTITNPYEFSVEEVYLQAVEVINQLNNNNE